MRRKARVILFMLLYLVSMWTLKCVGTWNAHRIVNTSAMIKISSMDFLMVS